jgi:hypothetical protein
MTWQIANPQYLRDTNGDKVIPYYSFSIRSGPEYGEKPIASKFDLSNSLLSVVTPATLSEYLLNLYSAFLKIHAKSFAKPYTPTQLIKITGHTVTCEGATDDEEYEWTLAPLRVDVRNGVFELCWKGTAHRMKIELNAAEDVEEEEQKSPALPPTAPQPQPIQEITIDAVPESTDTNSFLRLTSDSQIRDKRLLEEAKIRAKWAQYKAERAIAKYVERYGELDEELLSDDDEDESGSETDSE